MPHPAVAYVRTSGAERDDPHLGVEAQRRAFTHYARFRQLRLEEVLVDEDVPAGVPLEARPAGAQLVARLRRDDARGAAVLVLHLEGAFSAASECVALIEEWDGHGITLHVLDLDGTAVSTDSPVGRLVLSVLESAQTMEAAAARERARPVPAKRPKADAKPLLGERVVRGYIIPDPDEMRAVVRIQELARQGKSLRVIADTLDEEGVPTKRRAAGWSKEAIRLILQRVERGEVRSLRDGDGGPAQPPEPAEVGPQ